MTPADGYNEGVPNYKLDDDQIGYRPTKTGPDVTEQEAEVVPINAREQEFVETTLWDLRQR